MLIDPAKPARTVKKLHLHTDLVVIGGGMAGTCAAITAARKGIKVVLVQDRPVLGGNASSEVRLWILGATSHMGNNNRWAREGGVIDEILVENMYRNPEGNTLILDTILLEKVTLEPNIRLLLNTAVFETRKAKPNRIEAVHAFCSQNSTLYDIEATLFCDASGDGIVGFQSGAAFRMGAESSEEFNEPFAPSKAYGALLGHSMYFMSKDVGKPVKFVAPAYALKDITTIPRYRKFNATEHGCWLWWIEYGGRMDTVHDTEKIKWELWKVVYGVWDYIKNSGKFPEAENLTLEWVGQIPGKRESRRFVGHYVLKQSDIVQQVHFPDAIGHGGWAIDLHPADGIFSEKPGCNQWHSKGVYEIPYRCLISQNIKNLFLAGRIISASHVAFGSTRVMATCGHNAQAVGMAAAIAIKKQWEPADFLIQNRMKILQQALLKSGQFIPGLVLRDKKNLLHGRDVRIHASSILILDEIPVDGKWMSLTVSAAQMLPVQPGQVPSIEIQVQTKKETDLIISLRRSKRPVNFTPDEILSIQSIKLLKGEHQLDLKYDTILDTEGYVFICLHKNEHISVKTSALRLTGILSVFNKQNVAVSNYGKQEPDPESGFETFEFWVPVRRPDGPNIAMKITPGLAVFGVDNIANGLMRPRRSPNAWVAQLIDKKPSLKIEWPLQKQIQEIIITFDTDWDHPMESSLLGHSERIMPFTVNRYSIQDENGKTIFEKTGNYQTRNVIHFKEAIHTRILTFQFYQPSEGIPVSVFDIQVNGPDI